MSPPTPSEKRLDALLRRKRLSDIPKDQRDLLEREDAWAVDSKDKPHSPAHHPSHTVETAKQAYMVFQKMQNGQHALAHVNSSEAGQEADKGSGSSSKEDSNQGDDQIPDRQSDGRQALHPHEVLQSPRQSSPERPLSSWSQSPERPLPPSRAHVPSSVVRETPKGTAAPSPLQVESQALDIQMGDSVDGEVVDESDVDDLEMSLPQAHENLDVPVNRVAARLAMTATPQQFDDSQVKDTPPPCAQPSQASIIRETSRKAARSISPKPAAYGAEPRRHRHKKIDFGSSPSNSELPAGAPRRMPTTKTFGGIVASSLDTSSSIIPGSFETSLKDTVPPSNALAAAPQEYLQPARDATQVSQGSGKWRQADRIDASKHAASPHSTIEVAEASRISAKPLQSDRRNAHRGEVLNTWAAKPAHQISSDAYKAFVAQYPDYAVCHGGNRWNFILGCVSLNFIKDNRMLRECHYDEFIRAFPSYKQYVANAGVGQQALPAVEWFNLLRGRPQYDRMVVTMENLDAVLGNYPEEIERARSSLNIGDEAGGFSASKKPSPRPVQPTSRASPQPQENPPAQRNKGNHRPEPPSVESRAERSDSPAAIAPQRAPAQISRPPSPQLGSERAVSSSAVPPSTAPPRATRRTVSHSLGKFAGSARSVVPRKRALEEHERARKMEYYRRQRQLWPERYE
ncbi:hypothetical protein HIM_04605 [Hirsutella minnesotensis 3608]|uniref:Uncharacterized protein n=1 Tax=Hirsutella minnesotensis 3608 TaxID=1043627 RepID=A0A0F8A5Y7_9HYPO|nr:hypothetical protein HIM_04605 [Hirsutella minnesotensis 3608]